MPATATRSRAKMPVAASASKKPANLRNLKAAYRAWGKSRDKANIEPLQKLMADSFRIASMDETSPGLAFAADRPSKPQSIAYLTGIFDDWEMVHYTPQTFVEQGNKIAMFGKCAYKNKKTRKTVECWIANLWEFRNGKLVSMVDVFDSAKAAAAATP
ncbi:nuclear transport factor 2 family protein [Mesorhizobium sp. ZMM04-5]|uniref:Nuclear transport factor 2 family protein n=1 Tax=Mesorhizobium marinum TaxID=3228790 RepID=A0ABV3QWM5_9HYPH